MELLIQSSFHLLTNLLECLLIASNFKIEMLSDSSSSDDEVEINVAIAIANRRQKRKKRKNSGHVCSSLSSSMERDVCWSCPQ